MIRKRAVLDTVNPPGQVRPTHMEKPLSKHIDDFYDTEEMFTPGLFAEDVGNGDDKMDWPNRPPYVYKRKDK